jgi:hypothetical protein
MSKRKRTPRIPKVIQEQLAKLAQERVEALDAGQKAIDGWTAEQEKYRNLQKAHDGVLAAMADLRKQVDDLRRQRDVALEDTNMARGRLEISIINHARAMGWIDAKMDRPPEIEPDFNNGRPF